MTARGPVYDNCSILECCWNGSFTDLSKFWIKCFFVQRCEYQLIQLLVRGGAACYLSVGAMWSCVSPWEISRLFNCVRWRFSLRDVKQFSSSFRQVYILDTLTGQYLALLRIRNLICWGSRAYTVALLSGFSSSQPECPELTGQMPGNPLWILEPVWSWHPARRRLVESRAALIYSESGWGMFCHEMLK